MGTHSIKNAEFPNAERSQGIQDVLLVSSFALWAALIGFMPVLAFRLVTGT
jgi:hypothetical protein